MFTKNKTLIYITKSNLRISSVDLVKLTESVIGEFNWTAQTLDGILLKIKKEITDNVRILLSEDLVYTITIAATSKIPLRDNIRQIAQELIPENLNETIWDFKQVSPNLIQVVVVNKALFGPINSSIIKTGLRIEAIEPLSIAIARFTKNKDTPSLYVYIETEALFILAQKEVVLATEHISILNADKIAQFIAFAKEKFGIVPKEVIFCGNTRGIDFNLFMNQSFKLDLQDINPLISLAFKDHIKGKDEQVLNLFPSSFWQAPSSDGARPESPNAIRDAGQDGYQTVTRQASMTKIVKKHDSSKTTILAIFLLIAIVVLVALIILKVYL